MIKFTSGVSPTDKVQLDDCRLTANTALPVYFSGTSGTKMEGQVRDPRRRHACQLMLPPRELSRHRPTERYSDYHRYFLRAGRRCVRQSSGLRHLQQL